MAHGPKEYEVYMYKYTHIAYPLKASKETKITKIASLYNGASLSKPSLEAIIVTQSIKMLNHHGIIHIIIDRSIRTCKTIREKE